MKTQSITLCPARVESVARKRSSALDLKAMEHLLTGLAALLPVVTVMVLSLWALQSGVLDTLAAAYWAVGFVFLAASIESGGRTSILSALSGVASMLLAWLASRISPDFAILAGMVVSAWLAGLVVQLGRVLARSRR